MQKAQELKPAGVSRRTALKAFGTGIGTVAALPWLSDEGLLAFARIQESNAPPQPKVFSPSQFATLELLVDAIIPTDDRSPGAKQARVADYIDLLVSEGDRRLSLEWLGGLAALDGEAAARFRAPFVKLGPSQVDAIHANHQPQREVAADAARSVLRDGEAGDDSRATTRRRSAFTTSCITRATCSSRNSSAARQRTARIVRTADRSTHRRHSQLLIANC
jgi:hypothetical protein